MASDEEFSLVPDDTDGQQSEEELRRQIEDYKEQHARLLAEQKELTVNRDEQSKLTQDYNQRAEKLAKRLKKEKTEYEEKLASEKEKLTQLEEDQSRLSLAIQEVTAALEEEDAAHAHLKQQADVLRAAPEREVVFRGKMSNNLYNMAFNMTAKILYPMEGGTALVTFEEDAAALKIREIKYHTVSLGEDCRITVEATPLHLLLPRRVQIHTEVSRKRILISDLPDMDPEYLLNKLEIHFSKGRNGGGEVEDCQMLGDSGSVVITFLDDSLSAGLTEKEFHDVILQNKRSHRVRVTPFLNGQVSSLQNELTPCLRTVLLTGIPDVMERENLQDMLEIHFQKNGNGGGEIEAILYNPVGHQTIAKFESVAEDQEL